ncbi:hypothetical protein NDN08_004009 [Rhodosorus marinus]|uniref:DUF3598 domain-containing protein n=1 Tax=Rhodosorus marinus TaxID=101924 RepID=A0AAV8UH34_9RHOD|nr:hypothetical protein NDN08_004009 [Rhodosorus marinus]
MAVPFELSTSDMLDLEFGVVSQRVFASLPFESNKRITLVWGYKLEGSRNGDGLALEVSTSDMLLRLEWWASASGTHYPSNRTNGFIFDHDMDVCFVSGTSAHSLKYSDVAQCTHRPVPQRRRMAAALKAANIMTQEDVHKEQWDLVRGLLGGEWVGTYEKREFKQGRLEEPKDKGDLHYIIKFPEDTPDSGTWEGRKTANKEYHGPAKKLTYDDFKGPTRTSYVMPGLAAQSTAQWNPQNGKWIVEVNFFTTDFSRRLILAFYEPLPDKPKRRLTEFHICSYRDDTIPDKVPIDESTTPINRIKEIPSLEPTSSMALTLSGGEKKYCEPTDEDAHFNNMFGADRTLLPMRDSMFACVPEVIGESSELFFGMSTPSGAQVFGLRLDSEGIPCDCFTSIYGNHNADTGKK